MFRHDGNDKYIIMDDNSHNALEAYYQQPDGSYIYNSLQSSGNLFTVNFIRSCVPGSINITIKSITGIIAPTESDISFLTSQVNKMHSMPRNSEECNTIGWAYLGRLSADPLKSLNSDAVNAAIASATSQGYSFQSLYYLNGYTVFGCANLGQYYDQV